MVIQMNKNDLLYITLMVLGFLTAGVLIIILVPSVWWIGIIPLSIAIIIALWSLSVYLIPRKG